MHQYAFEKLEAWQCARKLIMKIYLITEHFPHREKFGMVSQIRRAAIAVASNIAEGSGRNTSKDQAHFYGIAYSSILEVLNQLIICNDLKFISQIELSESRTIIEELSNKLNRLKKSLVVTSKLNT